MTREDENGRRHKTGGRQKGTPNRTSVAVRRAWLATFADLQEEKGSENGDMIEWARDHRTEFYKLLFRMIPLQMIDPGSSVFFDRDRSSLDLPALDTDGPDDIELAGPDQSMLDSPALEADDPAFGPYI